MRFFRILFLSILSLVWCCAGWTYASQSGLRVAILPFKVNAETGKDYTFLQNGVGAMLSSRLAWPGKVSVIALDEAAKVLKTVEGFSGDSQALLVAAKLQADYVLYGSLTVLGQSVSIDAKLLDVAGKKDPVSFFQQCRAMDEVIPAINRFATQINDTVFGRSNAVAQRPPEQLQAKVTEGQATAGQPGVRQHPEKIVENRAGVVAAGINGGNAKGGSSLNPAFIQAEGRTKYGPEFWKSRTFNKAINAMAMGDIDSDGRIETLLATPTKVVAYRVDGRRMVKAYQVLEDKRTIIIGLDVADINGNGMPEIFVTRLNKSRNSLRSTVVEYDGSGFKTVVAKSAWYYRVVQAVKGNPVLYGQHQKTSSDDVFSEPVFQLGWESGMYAKQDRVLPSGKANALGFTCGDVTGEGKPIAVAYDRSDKLQVVGRSGTVQWKAGQRYGGSTLYYSLPKSEPGSVDLQYYPMRILIADLDQDGKTEVIAVKNYDVAGNLLKNFRAFKEAHIESFTWDGLGLVSNWKTRKISGHIRDFGIADFDHDGKKEIVAVVIISEGRIIGTQPRSAVIAYDLNLK